MLDGETVVRELVEEEVSPVPSFIWHKAVHQ